MENTAANVLRAMRGVSRQEVAGCTDMAKRQIVEHNLNESLDRLEKSLGSLAQGLVRQVLQQVGEQLAGPGRPDRLRATDAKNLPTVDTSRRQFEPKPVAENTIVEPTPEAGTVGVGWGGRGMQETLLRLTEGAEQSQVPNTHDRWIEASGGGKYEPNMRPADVEKELAEINMDRTGSGHIRCRRCGHIFYGQTAGKPLVLARKHFEDHRVTDSMGLASPVHMIESFLGNRNF